MVEMLPESFSETHFEDLTVMLGFLKTETFLFDLDSQNENEENIIIPEYEQAALQDLCRRLAKGVKQFYESSEKALPEVIDFWLKCR